MKAGAQTTSRWKITLVRGGLVYSPIAGQLGAGRVSR